MSLRLIAGTLAAVLGTAAHPAAAGATTYHVDSQTGSDASEGTTPRTAWRTLDALGGRRFAPGDSILFARGSQFTGGFVLLSSGTTQRPIVLSSYGTGAAPAFTNPTWAVLNGNIIRVVGSHVVISGLYFRDNTNPPTDENSHHDVQKMGAVFLATRADSNVVRDCEFARSPVAIKVKGSYNLITRNYLHDASQQMQKTWGAIAIMIVGPHNEISYNRIERYGFYGGAYARTTSTSRPRAIPIPPAFHSVRVTWSPIRCSSRRRRATTAFGRTARAFAAESSADTPLPDGRCRK